MKNILIILVCFIFKMNLVAQPQIPPQLPKQEIAKPQANVRLIELNNVIVGKWKGARLSYITNGTVTVDSLWFDFKKDGTLNFKHQKYELNGPTVGTYTVTKNSIKIVADKFPFTHTLQGIWSINDGVINGNFREVRERDASQPTYYTPGTETGTFNLTKQ